jgi:hypothetical protein
VRWTLRAIMHTRHCLELADRIHQVMQRELDHSLDRQRMLEDPRYSRDVLLVCDALHNTPAPLLAHHFRRAAALPEEQPQPRQGMPGAGLAQALFAKRPVLETAGW